MVFETDIILRRSTIGACIDSFSLYILLTMPTQKLVTDFFFSRVTANLSINEEIATILTPISAADGAPTPKSRSTRRKDRGPRRPSFLSREYCDSSG